MSGTPPESPQTVAVMATAVLRFLAALTDAQRDQAVSDFADEGRRRDWSFLPVPERDGLQIGALNDDQRKLAHALIAAGTSLPGYAKVVSVMAMEHVLRALTEASGSAAVRLFDPGRYCIKVFGQPDTADVWGWQFAGHHVSLNFTVAGGRYVSPTPSLLGSEPAFYGTLAPLADDEARGFRFVNSLSQAQRAAAVICRRPPPDLVTRIVPRIGEVERPDPVFPPEPVRVGGRHLTRRSALLPHPGAGPAHRARQHAGRRQPHIHSVWRNPADDFGDDILAAHYRQHHVSGHRESGAGVLTCVRAPLTQFSLHGRPPERLTLSFLWARRTWLCPGPLSRRSECVMTCRLVAVCFDANDPPGLARFWAGVLGRETAEDPQEGITLLPGDDTEFLIRFLPAQERMADQNHWHLHLTSTSPADQRQTVARLVGLGARHIDIGQRPEEGHVVLADPEGNLFCVIGPGNKYLAGCGFLAEVTCEGSRDVGCFWSQALGWPLVWDQGLQTAIQSPKGGPKISWDAETMTPQTGKSRLHFDLAPVGGDLHEEAGRLVSLGATRAGTGQGEASWVAMADPDGREFRVLSPR